VIAYNGGVGIEANGYAGLQFVQNSIFANADRGIQLDGPTNNGLLAPVLAFAPTAGSTGTLSGTFKGSPNASHVVQIFSNPTKPAPSQEQGKTFLQSVTVTTDGSGHGTFSLTEPIGLYFTASVTDPLGDTSQLSAAVGSATSATLAASTTTVSSSENSVTVGQSVTFTAIVTAPSFQGTPTGTVTFTIDGQSQAPVSLALVGSSDQAQFTTSTFGAGSHTVTASYSGDTNVSSSSGSLPTETVTAQGLNSTTTLLGSSLNPSKVGDAITITAIVSPNGAAGNPSGTVTFTIDGASHAPVALHVVNGHDQATLSIASLAAGKHTINAAYSGDSSFATSSVASPLVQMVSAVTAPVGDGPTIENVQRFGVHMQPTVLVVSFNDPLDPISAVNLSNYRITDPAGRKVRIRSAVFNAETNTVTLRPAERINLHHTYHLTVIGTGPGGVRNTQGQLLDGPDTGTADGNYVGTLTWRNVVLTPAESAKYDHRSHHTPAGALKHRFLADQGNIA
jgi:hypothetical protein